MMKLKLTKEQRFTLSRESAFLETPQANQTDPSSFLALINEIQCLNLLTMMCKSTYINTKYGIMEV